MPRDFTTWPHGQRVVADGRLGVLVGRSAQGLPLVQFNDRKPTYNYRGEPTGTVPAQTWVACPPCFLRLADD